MRFRHKVWLCSVALAALAGCGSGDMGGDTGPGSDVRPTDAQGDRATPMPDASDAGRDVQGTDAADVQTPIDVPGDMPIAMDVQPDTVVDMDVQPDTVGTDVQPDTVVGMDVQPDTAVGMDVQPDTAVGMDVQPDTAVGMDVQADVRPDVQPDVQPDVRPDVLADASDVLIAVDASDASADVADARTGPANDTRAGATVIDLTMPATNITATTTGALNDTAASCNGLCGAIGNQHDVFYTFTLTRSEIVYADTFGASYDTLLFLQDSAGTNLTLPGTCNDDSNCAAPTGTQRQSQIAARLPAGTYYLVLSTCNGPTGGAATIHFQHAVVGSGSGVTQIDNTSTFPQSTSGTLVAGASNVMGGRGAEDTIWFTTCQTDTAELFNATTCTTNTQFDSVLRLVNPGSTATPSAENDDSCGFLSSLTTTIPAGGGLHVLYVDSFATTSAGEWTVNYRFGSCAASMTNCTGTCRDITSSDTACGACTTSCAGTTPVCSNSACRATPTNDSCATATPITLLPTGMTTTVTGTTNGATHDADTVRCNGVGRDVYYSVTLTQREVVYVDSLTSGLDTIVGFAANCTTATPATDCNDDACGGLQSQTFRVLDPGTYYIVVTTYRAATAGAFTLHLQHFPVPGAPTGTIPSGTYAVMGNNTGAPSTAVPAVCGTASGASPQQWWYWLTCTGAAAGTLSADTCTGTTWDSIVSFQNGAMAGATVCNDDTTSCGPMGHGSRISAPVTAGAGIHGLFIQNYAPASPRADAVPGAYTLSGTRP